MKLNLDRIPMPYIIGNGLAVAIGVLAAGLNSAFGYRKEILWPLPLFEFAYALLTGFFVFWQPRNVPDATSSSSAKASNGNDGKKASSASNAIIGRSRSLFRLSVLWFTPAFFLFISIITLISVITSPKN